MVWVPPPLHEIRQKLDEGLSPTITVRTLLQWFQSERRGSRVVSSIHAALRDLDMTTTPNFEDAWIDGELAFSYVTPRPALVERPATAPPPAAIADEIPLPSVDMDGTSEPPGSTFVGSDGDRLPENTAPTPQPPPAPEVSALHARHDPVFRLGRLAAANHKPEYVNLDTSLNEAVTRMMRWDFSQLPVLSNLYRVEGAITWKSIVRSYTLKSDAPLRVRDCLDFAPVSRPDDSVFEALTHIVTYGFTLVLGKKGVQGLVTLADITSEFRGSLEPFVLIGEIERHLRQLLDRKLPLEVIRTAVDPKDAHKIQSAAELSFGQYRRLLEQESVWVMCGLRVDRKQFIGDIEAIRLLRNEIMHFQREAMSDEDMQNTRGFAVFLRELVA